MENNKDLIYLAMLVRGLRRISKASGQDEIPVLNELVKPVEQQFTLLMEKAEMLSLGDLKYPDGGYHIPNGRGLQCIQNIIKTNKAQADYIQPMMPVSLESRFFPVKEDSFQNQIVSLWKDIKENIYNLQSQDIKVLSENILNVLFRFAVSIPSTETTPDVSLYDQTHVAAAIAICLYDLQSSGETSEKEVFRLIGGDFSGIQSYIYQIVSKYAGKNLKGRSFYLNILADAVVRKLLKELSLYRANIVYNSGGCFYILAPNTSFVRNTLSKTIKDIEQNIFESHGTQLFVAIDSVTLSEREIANKEEGRPLNKVWQELFLCRDNKKSRRYADAITHNYAKFFTPQSIDGFKRDVITGEDFASDESPKKLPGTFGENAFTSKENYAQIKIGQELKETDVLIVSQDKLDFFENNHAHICPANLGQYYYLADLKDINNKSIQDKGSRVSVIFFNGKNFNTDYTLEKSTTNNICSLQFYGGNYFNGNTFEEMCDNEGLSRLGVLRMDVDNLGSIFQSGIPEKQSSFARFASLSRSFDYFFSGYLNTICREDSRRDHSFIVYSGGDDVFIVGSWDTTIDIAWQIHKDFTQYTCNNAAFSISGGIAILNAKYPIIAGAQESAEEEERAKGHECGTQKKNSISFLGTPLNWEKEFPAVRNLKKELVSLLKVERLPKSFLSKIMELSQSANYQNHKIFNFKVYWLLAYTLKRMKERYNKYDETKALLDRCLNEVCHNSGTLNGENITSNYNPLQIWAFACRWAELEYRTNNN